MTFSVSSQAHRRLRDFEATALLCPMLSQGLALGKSFKGNPSEGESRILVTVAAQACGWLVQSLPDHIKQEFSRMQRVLCSISEMNSLSTRCPTFQERGWDLQCLPDSGRVRFMHKGAEGTNTYFIQK